MATFDFDADSFKLGTRLGRAGFNDYQAHHIIPGSAVGTKNSFSIGLTKYSVASSIEKGYRAAGKSFDINDKDNGVALGATILQIIPSDQGLEFETRVDPTAIDQVFLGQDAKLTLSALNQRTTPELN